MADKKTHKPRNEPVQASAQPADVGRMPKPEDCAVDPVTASATVTRVSGNPAYAWDARSRHGTQAVEVTTGGISRELGIRKNPANGAPISAPVLEMTYLALVQLTVDCDASMEGVPQYFTLAPGMFIQSGQTTEGASGTPVARIEVQDPGNNSKTLYLAKALGATENAVVLADTPIDINDTRRKNLVTVTVTGAAGGTARLSLNAGLMIGGWK